MDLSVLEDFVEAHLDAVEGHALALVDRDRVRQPQRHLHYFIPVRTLLYTGQDPTLYRSGLYLVPARTLLNNVWDPT